jgi:pimeloyl-ACP methyl ester carboxylesterase
MAERPSETLARVAAARLPLLLIVASDTVATDHGRRALERFRSEVASAEIVELDSGHDLLADAPEKTIDLVARFLTATASRRSPG